MFLTVLAVIYWYNQLSVHMSGLRLYHLNNSTNFIARTKLNIENGVHQEITYNASEGMCMERSYMVRTSV